MKRYYRFLPLAILTVIFILGVSVRFIGLGNNPAGLVDDEADEAYDAYSLLKTGKDQWGESWPIASFRGFGDYRLPGYTYFAIPSIKVFGLTPFAVRFPSALFGSLTILLVYALTKELFSKSVDRGKLKVEILSVLAAFFLAVSPWHIGMSRIALEETASVFFITFGLLALLKGRDKKYLIILGCIVFGMSLYIYTPNITLVPFLFILVFYLFRSEYKRFWKQIFFGLACFAVIASAMVFLVGTSTVTTRTRQVNLTNDSGTIDLVNEKRGSCKLVYPDIVCKIVFNKYSTFTAKFATNYLNHFSPNLLSIYGTVSQYSILPSRGLLYLIDYPLFLLSVIVLFAFITPARLLLIGMLLFSAIPDSFTSDGHYGRFFISFPVWPILISLGLVSIIHGIKHKRFVIMSIIVVYGLALASFLVEYWTFFPYRYSVYSHYGYQELTSIIQSQKNSYDKIIVSSRVHDSKQYIYYLFFTKYDPAVFQTGKNIEKVQEGNGWVRVKRVDSIEFLPTIPSVLDLKDTHALLIGDPTEFPKKIPVIFTVNDKKGDAVFQGVDSRVLYPLYITP